MSCLSTNTTTTTTAPSSSPPPPNTTTTTTATADQLHERYYSPKNYSSFDTDINPRTRLNINLDPTGHAYLPFHPTSFGFEFPPNSSFPFSLGSSTGRLVMGMMQNPIPIDIDVNNTTIDNNSVGEASTTLPTSKQDWGYAHTRTHITVNPSDLSSFSEIDQNRRRESGESGTSTVVSRVLDVGDDDAEDEEDELRSPSSSRSGSPEVVIQTKVEVVPKTERTLGSRSRSISASASASGFRTRSPEGEREGEREYSPVPPRRATRRRSSVKSSVGSDDDDDADQDCKGNASGKKGKNGNRNKKIKLAPKRTTSNTSSGSTSNSNSNSASSNSTSTSTSTTTSTSSDAVVHHPDSAFHIPDPPHPFSFKDLGLQPPPPFCSTETGHNGSGTGDEDEDEVGKDGRVVVKGKRREMNRVAAKRHREKNKDRLKSLEKRKVWLDHAVAEYEKSNKRLSETLDRLKRENMMLKGIDVGA